MEVEEKNSKQKLKATSQQIQKKQRFLLYRKYVVAESVFEN